MNSDEINFATNNTKKNCHEPTRTCTNLYFDILSSFVSVPKVRVRVRTVGTSSWLIFFLFLSIASCTTKLPVCELAIERDGQQVALVKAEIASTYEERNKGLMFRKKLPEGRGMLFVYDRDEVMSFWMKNTYIPLSIAYIASDGKIIDIKDMYPHDETAVTSSRSVRYALEVPQGWFSGVGVKSGDIAKVDYALKNSKK